MTDTQPDIKMTEERAREIVQMWNETPPKDIIEREAQCFLAGIEHERQAAKGLVEALEKLAADTPAEFIPELVSMGFGVTGSQIAKDALAAYKARTEGKSPQNQEEERGWGNLEKQWYEQSRQGPNRTGEK